MAFSVACRTDSVITLPACIFVRRLLVAAVSRGPTVQQDQVIANCCVVHREERAHCKVGVEHHCRRPAAANAKRFLRQRGQPSFPFVSRPFYVGDTVVQLLLVTPRSGCLVRTLTQQRKRRASRRTAFRARVAIGRRRERPSSLDCRLHISLILF